MGYIKEPEGVDFVVDPTPLTAKDRNRISEIIAFYKVTGQKMLLQKHELSLRGQRRKHVKTTKAVKKGNRHLATQK